jgi:hypothetical protein
VARHDGQQDDGTALKAWFALLPGHVAMDACFDSNGEESDGCIDPTPDLTPDLNSDLDLDLDLVVQSDLGVAFGSFCC